MLDSVASNSSKSDPFDSEITEQIAKAVKKGRPSTDDLFDKAAAAGVDPFDILLQIADGNRMALDLDDGDDAKPISPELRAMAARELLKYMYPTMKSAEVTGKDGKDFNPKVVTLVFEGDEDEPIPTPEPAND